MGALFDSLDTSQDGSIDLEEPVAVRGRVADEVLGLGLALGEASGFDVTLTFGDERAQASRLRRQAEDETRANRPGAVGTGLVLGLASQPAGLRPLVAERQRDVEPARFAQREPQSEHLVGDPTANGDGLLEVDAAIL